MRLNPRATCCSILVLFISCSIQAQLYKIDLSSKINKASLIVEGRVVSKYSFWNSAHTFIYTSNKIQVSKFFKGRVVSKEIEIITQGGTVGNKCLKVSDVLQLRENEKGMFFLLPDPMNIQSPVTKNILYDVYSSEQGFLKYNEDNSVAIAPFARYQNIDQNLYNLIRNQTGVKEQVVNTDILSSGNISNGTGGVLASITSFSPASVHGGAINDPANNILTITGAGFGNNPSNKAGVSFKDANNDNTNPDYKVNYNSPYIVSWSDAQIKVNVPDRAGTGKFAVILNDGTSINSSTSLDVFFSVLDAEFNPDTGPNVVREPRLMNTNSLGGYSIKYSTNTAGGGKDFNASPVKQTFQRALATWQEIAGANLAEGGTTTNQVVADDDENIVMFDNNNTGVPKMADGVLESTYSWFSACTQGTNILTAQKTGFDIIVRNNGVSVGGSVSFENGPCFPSQGSYDLEMIILHELGHALNLAHINDDFEDGGNGYATVNPSKLMHYAILDYVDRRSPDAAAYQGVLYTITPQGNIYGNCGLATQEMTPLASLAISNDECPSTFPATEIDSNTVVTFDLVHATSNKLKDPSFKQVTCSGAGTFVTNNAYYAFYTGEKSSVTLSIENYATTPAAQKSCTAQGVRLSLYDVQSCPAAQSFPTPVTCFSNITGNTFLTLNSLQKNHKYLLYFDGLRNTKASFDVVFDKDSTIQQPNTTTVTIFPNPIITGDLTVRVTNTSGSFYEYALFDDVGRLLSTNKIQVSQSTQTFSFEMRNVASGIYFLRLVDDSGKTISKTKILKVNK